MARAGAARTPGPNTLLGKSPHLYHLLGSETALPHLGPGRRPDGRANNRVGAGWPRGDPDSGPDTTIGPPIGVAATETTGRTSTGSVCSIGDTRCSIRYPGSWSRPWTAITATEASDRGRPRCTTNSIDEPRPPRSHRRWSGSRCCGRSRCTSRWRPDRPSPRRGGRADPAQRANRAKPRTTAIGRSMSASTAPHTPAPLSGSVRPSTSGCTRPIASNSARWGPYWPFSRASENSLGVRGSPCLCTG